MLQPGRSHRSNAQRGLGKTRVFVLWRVAHRPFQTSRLGYYAGMLDRSDIDAIAAEVARSNLPEGALISTWSQPYDGPYGGDELMVKVVIKDLDFDKVTGRQFTRIVGDLQQRLIARGEMRFANIDWDTDAPPLPDPDQDVWPSWQFSCPRSCLSRPISYSPNAFRKVRARLTYAVPYLRRVMACFT